MGLHIQKKDDRSELQKRIAQELDDKAKKKAKIEGERVDGVDDSAFIEGSKQTTSLAWIWAIIAIAIIAIVIFFAIKLTP